MQHRPADLSPFQRLLAVSVVRADRLGTRAEVWFLLGAALGGVVGWGLAGVLR